MAVLDIFNSDFFGVVSLTQGLDLIPYKTNWLGSLGIFQQRAVSQTTVVIEERHGRLSLVPTSARGTNVTTENRKPRKGIPFLVPHLALTSGLQADDVQNIRAFGQENVTETVAGKVNEISTQLRDDIEITKEYHRFRALQGNVLDADLSTSVNNFFTAFGVSEVTKDFVLSASTNTGAIKTVCADVVRTIHTALGGKMMTGVVGVCGDDWFDDFVANIELREAYDRWQDSLLLRTLQIGGAGYILGADGQPGFSYGGITFINSRASIGANKFIADAECRFFPTGVPDLFLEINAPADYIETVNTPGLPFYVKQERMKMDKGIEIEVQANPLIMPTLPGVLIKGTQS